ncbi:MAG TPA: sigma-70 family RNA polymerase sigma factor, partial [Isosphaeraceae bacterium]
MSKESPTAGVHNLLGELFRGGSFGGLDDAALLDRFAEAEEEMAFAALVERHGPMVLRVCRSVLGDLHEAEDAYQATFLLLALRARSIRRRGSVAPWLFGVARRVSTRARRAEARRRDRDRLAASQRVGAVDAPSDPLP